jgi:hypothetical protein
VTRVPLLLLHAVRRQRHVGKPSGRRLSVAVGEAPADGLREHASV